MKVEIAIKNVRRGSSQNWGDKECIVNWKRLNNAMRKETAMQSGRRSLIA